jgi:hypothetical protein
MKKKTRGKTVKKTAKKKSAPKKQADAAQVREDISGMVKADAREITSAVIAQAMNGELAPAKYLFEMAGVYPPATDGSQATTEEDCLAKTLLERLGPERKAAVVEDVENAAVENADEDDGGGESGGRTVVAALPSGSD